MGEEDGARPVDHGAVFQQSVVPQVVCDAAGTIIDANAALCALVGRPRTDLVGSSLRSLNHVSDAGVADVALSRLLAGEIATARVQRVLRGPGGAPVPMHVDANVRRSGEGRVLGGAAWLRDLRAVEDIEWQRQQQEAFFAALSRKASDLAVVADGEGRMLYISAAITQMLGYTAADTLLRTGWEFIHPDDMTAVRLAFESLVRDGGSSTIRLRVRAADGSWRHFEETMTNMLQTPVGGVVCNLRDVTAQVHAQRALAASEARYRAIVENVDEGIWVVSETGRTEFVNKRMLRILGLDAEQVAATSPAELLGAQPHGPGQELQGTGGAVPTRRHELDYAHPDGDVRRLAVVATPLRDDTGFQGSQVLVSDITASRTAARRLEHAATHDLLTDLPNRSELQRRVTESLARSPRSTAVLFVDLDQFKVVNDARGHGVGDELLRAVAARLDQAGRPGEFVARFGGDEFVVVCEGVTPQSARAVAERVLAAVERPVQSSRGRVDATASIGIAMSPASSAEHLLRQADTAMYAAKRDGSRSIRFFDDDLAAQAEKRFRLGRDLRKALDAESLHLAYQPIVSLGDGTVLGAEALARWWHPTAGVVPPSMFVPLALEAGLVAELDAHGVRQATRDLAWLRSTGAVLPSTYVSLNISARSLDRPELLGLLDSAVSQAGLTPHDLVVEVTEASVVSNSKGGLAALQALSGSGYRVAIDDFGTGHSALVYLRELPVETLKIDQAFVRDLADSKAARAIAASIIDLAHGLGMTVIAEGIELPTQVEVLRDLGCDGGQGWWWSHAVTREEAEGSGCLRRTY